MVLARCTPDRRVEFSLGIYLTVKGFKPCAITAELTAAATQPATRVTA